MTHKTAAPGGDGRVFQTDATLRGTTVRVHVCVDVVGRWRAPVEDHLRLLHARTSTGVVLRMAEMVTLRLVHRHTVMTTMMSPRVVPVSHTLHL